MDNEIELQLNGSSKKITMKYPTYKQRDDFVETLIKITKNQKPEDIQSYYNKQEMLLSELSGMSIEDIRELPIPEGNKMVDFVNKQFQLFGAGSDFTETSKSQ